MRFVRYMVVWAVVLGADGALAEGDAERGKLLYGNHCISCHDSVVHVRDARKADSRTLLRGWVTRWQETLKLPWAERDREDVAEYLNQTYYHFPDPNQ